MSLVTIQDSIGDSGEHFVTGLLMTKGLFIAKLFGGKTPSFDIFAMINDENTPFPLLIQVKTTEKQKYRYNKTNTSINTPVSNATIKELASMPIPTYVAGYDLQSQILYMAPVFSGEERYPTIPVKHKLPLNDQTVVENELMQLKDDVVHFFENKNHNLKKYKQSYISKL